MIMTRAVPLPFPPTEPPLTHVVFPDPRRAGRREILAVGADFSPGTLLAAYRAGIFPWPQSRTLLSPFDPSAQPSAKSTRAVLVPWCSPDPRAIFPIEEAPHWSRSLRRTLRIHPFTVSIDTAFEEVMRACGDEREEGTWINEEMIAGYTRLHRLGWAHSVEVWAEVDSARALVGGIYGLAIGRLFAGESMFHRRTDASKIAFAALVERLRQGGFTLFDVQVMNPHLFSLGCVEIRRIEYLRRLEKAIVGEARTLR
ncbi:MAG: leucyl/phenylalanyl-tRNA--protein transferase [Polyangiales bacterium]